MRRHQPPPSLPAAYAEIWRVLKQADEESPSRQALARQLGISTHTLQRILVDGDVPPFPETKNTRIVRSWTRTLTRLALHFGRDPGAWIRMVGIPWDETISGVVAAAQRSRRGIADTGRRGRSDEEQPWPEEIRIGLVQADPFVERLYRAETSFLHAFTRRLLGGVAPNTRLSFKVMPEDQILAHLGSPGSPLHLGAGVRQTVSRMRRGVEFLSIPGCRIPLHALCVRPVGGASRAPRWRDVISPAWGTPRDFLVAADGVAEQFLTGQVGIGPERLLRRAAADAGQLGEILWRESERRPERWIVLVANAPRCRRVQDALERSEGFGRNWVLHVLEGAHGEGPAYPITLAMGPVLAAHRDLLRASRDQELFSHALSITAELYAALSVTAWRSAGGVASDARRLWRPDDFDLAAIEFRDTYCRRLLLMLEGAIAEITSESPAALAADYARLLTPPAWQARLEMMMDPILAIATRPGREAKEKPGFPGLCRSCSAALDDLHRGTSERFCRFCSDETGTLKPRAEVQRVIARWFQHWQGALSDDEAMRRADLYMQALPAWNRN